MFAPPEPDDPTAEDAARVGGPVELLSAPRPLVPRRPSPPRSTRRSRPRRAGSRSAGAGARPSRAARIVSLATILALLPTLVSFVSTMTQRSSSSFGVRAVEWLRDNGARGIVNDIENAYYSLNAPAEGGPALRALPSLPGSVAAVLAPRAIRHARPHYHPQSIAPIVAPALPGEGVWHATFTGGGGEPPVLITSYRPDPSYPDVVAGIAWIDHTRTSTWLYPGLSEPAVAMSSRGPEEVPADRRFQLVATFNSGFKLADSQGGFAYGGRTYASMQAGEATFVRYTNGHVDIIPWRGGSTVGPSVTYARQNLPPIVDGGRPNPNLADGPQWGATLGNAVRVWRSAVGIDRRGNLLYVAANDQTVGSLAAILVHAGAVRAMELDINAYWPSFITYRRPGAADPANLLPSMQRSPLRYLTPDDRDFFAVYVR